MAPAKITGAPKEAGKSLRKKNPSFFWVNSENSTWFQELVTQYNFPHLGVSKNRGTPKYPQIIHFNRVFHYKQSILGAHPYFWVQHPSLPTFMRLGTPGNHSFLAAIGHPSVQGGLWRPFPKFSASRIRMNWMSPCKRMPRWALPWKDIMGT